MTRIIFLLIDFGIPAFFSMMVSNSCVCSNPKCSSMNLFLNALESVFLPPYDPAGSAWHSRDLRGGQQEFRKEFTHRMEIRTVRSR